MNPLLLLPKAGLPASGLEQQVESVALYPFWRNVVFVIQVAPPSVEISTTPPSKAVVAFSKAYWCQKLSSAIVAYDGMAIGLVLTSIWSEMLEPSGAKAAPTPECEVLVITQPQPPGTHVGTCEVN